MLKKRVAVLVSGGGTNLQALIDAVKSGIISSGEIVLVLSDNPQAYALTRAAQQNVKALSVDKKACTGAAEFETKILNILAEENIDLIVLAGFLTILSGSFVRCYEGRIINIHPSLIPAFCGEGFYGIKVHEAALQRGVKLSGATVHFVNDIPDGGRIIAQKTVPILDGDTPHTLQRRVMEQAEWQILPYAVEQVCKMIENKEHQGGAT